jgi:hypothetical protein
LDFQRFLWKNDNDANLVREFNAEQITKESIIDPDLIGMKISPHPSLPKRGNPLFYKEREREISPVMSTQ